MGLREWACQCAGKLRRQKNATIPGAKDRQGQGEATVLSSVKDTQGPVLNKEYSTMAQVHSSKSRLVQVGAPPWKNQHDGLPTFLTSCVKACLGCRHI